MFHVSSMKQEFLQNIFRNYEIYCKFIVMKRILILTIFTLVICFKVFGQERESIQDNNIDGYGKISWKDEQKRLQDNLLVEIAKHPTWKAYLIFYYKNKSELKLIKSRQQKIQKFFKDNNVPQNRFQLVISRKNTFYRTSIWIIPEEEKNPS